VKVVDIGASPESTDAALSHPLASDGGLEQPVPSHIHQLEEENRRLKRLVVEQALEIQALKEAFAK
jgi:putative transposase